MHTTMTNRAQLAEPRDLVARIAGAVVAALAVVAIAMSRQSLAPWAVMWLLAFILFGFFKWLSWNCRSSSGCPAKPARTWNYFLGWVGMDADAFCGGISKVPAPRFQEWIVATGHTLLGASLLWGVIRFFPEDQARLTGAIGLAAIVLLLHFGIFHLLALAWRRRGVDVEPIMNAPLRAASLADFWGRRWNRAYRKVSHDCFFQPAAHLFGATAGIVAAFLASGLIHEMAVSVPARGGYGGPTAYFLVQALGLLLERTTAVQTVIRRRLVWGRCFTALFVIGPAAWLFHTPFLTRVIVPFLVAIGAAPSGGLP